VVLINNLNEARAEHQLLLLLGHGDYSQGQARFILKESDINSFDLLNHQHALHFIGASACLLGVEQDFNGEPLGLLSLCGCRHDIAFNYGALIPVDDLLSVCLSILFHCHWRELKNPQAAIQLALKQIASGHWSNQAREIFTEVFIEQLPLLLKAMYAVEQRYPSDEAIKARHATIREDWHEGKQTYVKYAEKLKIGDTAAIEKQLATALVGQLLNHITNSEIGLRKTRQFAAFWMW
jgi:hypothetical protein